MEVISLAVCIYYTFYKCNTFVINCQLHWYKLHLFIPNIHLFISNRFFKLQILHQGNKYWRFDDGVLEEDYPRDINVGFEKIPDDVDAAFAIAAPGHHGKEKVYFFKGHTKS